MMPPVQAFARYLLRLVPANPLIVRTVQGGSRRVSHLWVRMGYLGVLVVLVLIGLIVGGGMGGSGMSLTELAQAGSQVFGWIAYGQVLLVCLLAPIFMAGAIASEQSGRTYEILLTTPLSNLQIVLGSLLGRLFFVLALVFSGLPLFAVLLVFGGVPIASIFKAFAVAGLVAVFVGSIAVTLSVMRAGGKRAVYAFVFSVGAYLLVFYLIDVLLLRGLPRFGSGGTGYSTWLTPLHPLLVLDTTLDSDYRPPPAEELSGYWGPLAWYARHPFAAFAALSGLGSLVMIGLCGIVLRRVVAGESRLLTMIRGRVRRTHGGERRRRARTVGHNPIAWREAHGQGRLTGGTVGKWAFAAIGLIGAGAVLLAYHLDASAGPGGGSGPEAFQAAVTWLLVAEITIICVVAVFMAAGAVSREREDGTLDILLTTPITPRYYIWGKLKGLVRYLAAMIAVPVLTLAAIAGYTGLAYALDWGTAVVPHYVTSHGAPARYDHLLILPEAAVLLAMMLVPFVAFSVATGMSWSLKSKGVLGAVVPTLAVVTAVALVLGLCGSRMAEAVPLLGPVINALSPLTCAMMIVDPWANVVDYSEQPVFGRVTLWLGAVCAAGLYAAIVYSLIAGTVKNFDQTVRRLSGG